MRQSHLFTKTRREAPQGEVAKNAQLLIRAGFIHKEMAGVYTFLPLGLRTLNNIMNVIREEMDAIGGQEVLLTGLQDKELWEKTDRWSDEKVDAWFKTALKNGGELGLGITHEEPLTNLMREHVHSYRDLPVYPYQIQLKFRNELRAKSGLMRGREFFMKDLYSFSRSIEEHEAFYEKSKEAYMNVFRRCGLGERTYETFASGGIFSKFSHEFQTVSEAGEDTIYLDEQKNIAINDEVLSDDVLGDLGLTREQLVEKKAIEVGNIFSLGTRFSEALGLTYADENGNDVPVVMGSYGIGPNRLMGTIVEVLADRRGIVWPEGVAPFALHLVRLGEEDQIVQAADSLYEKLVQAGVEVLYDDRDLRAGEKFADADLMGIPKRAVVSEKTLAAGKVEVTQRASGETTMRTEEELMA